MRLWSLVSAREHFLVYPHGVVRYGVPPMVFDGATSALSKHAPAFRVLAEARHMTCEIGDIRWVLDKDSADSWRNPLCGTGFARGDDRKSTGHGLGNDHAKCVIGRWKDECVTGSIDAFDGIKGWTEEDPIIHSCSPCNLRVERRRRMRDKQQLRLGHTRQAFNRNWCTLAQVTYEQEHEIRISKSEMRAHRRTPHRAIGRGEPIQVDAMMNHLNVRAAAIECGQILANFAGDGNNAPRNIGIEVLFERADSRLENVILRGEPLFEALARVEPASGADMGSDDVRPQTAQPLRVNNIESPGNGSCCGPKSQNRGKRRESPCRNMVKANCRVLIRRQRVCEHVNFMPTTKTLRQLDN